MDTSKGQGDAEIKEVCSKNERELVIVPLSLTYKFKPIDNAINQKAKKFVSNKFNTWYGDCVCNQLKRDVTPRNVKTLLKLSDLKPLHTHWVVEMYGYIKQQKQSILNGSDKASITEAASSANKVFASIEGSFYRKTSIVDFCLCSFLLLKKTIEIFKYVCLYFSYFLTYCWLLFTVFVWF